MSKIMILEVKKPKKEYKSGRRKVKRKTINVKEIKTPKRVVVTVGLLERLTDVTNEWIEKGYVKSESEAIRKILDHVLKILEKQKEETGSYVFPKEKSGGY